MSNHENAGEASGLEGLIEEKKAVEAEKNRLTEEIEALNDQINLPETSKEEKPALKAKMRGLQAQNRVLKIKLTDVEDKIFRLQGQDADQREEKRGAKPPKQKRGSVVVNPPVEPVGQKEEVPPLSVERSRTSGDLRYSANLDDVLLVLKTKRGLRGGNRAEAVTNYEIKPTEEIKKILEKAGNRELSPEEKKAILSILKSFPNNEESNIVHDTVLDILKNDGKLTEADFGKGVANKKPEGPTPEKIPSREKIRTAPRPEASPSDEGEKVTKLRQRILEAKHQLEIIQKKITKLKGGIEKAKTLKDYTAIAIAENVNSEELKRERQAETEKINQIEALEDELQKFRNPESKKENPIENPQEKPEEPTEIKPKKVGSTLLTKLEGEIATIDEKIAEIDTKIDTLQKTIEKQKKEMDLLLKAQIIEGGLQRKISQYQETIKPQKEELASLNEERASLQSEKEKLQKDAEEVSKGPGKTGLKELQSLKQEARDRNKIKEAVNLDQLTSALASIEKIPSSTHSSFTGEEMIAVIQDLRSENPTMTLLDVTRGYDLRDKVEELLRVENPGGIERSEFNKIEERLNKAREKYSQEYLVYVQSQNKPSLLNKALSALGMAKKAEEVGPNESYIEAKKEYDEALAAMGQYLFDAKKEQLERISEGEGGIDDDETGFLLQRFSEEDDGTHSIGYRVKRIIDIREGRLTESEKDLLLKNYKMRSIFQKVVLDEHNLLTQRSIELQPKSEKGGARKIFDSAVKRFAALPQSVKMVAGLSIIIGAGAMTSGVSLPILASTKVISMLSSMAAARGVGWLADNVSFLKDGSGKRHEKTMQEIRNAFAKGEKSVAQALSETGGAKNKQADEAAKYRLARTLWMAAGGALAGLGVREYLGSAPILHHAPASTEATPSSDQLTPQTEPSPVHHPTSHIVNHDVSNNLETQPEWKHAVVGIEQPDDPAWRGIDHTMERYPEYQRLNPIQRIFVTHSVYHDVLQQSHHHGHHLREIIITPQQFHHHIINSSHFHDPHRIQQIMHDQRRFESFHLRNTHRMPVNVGRNLVFKLQNQAFHHHR